MQVSTLRLSGLKLVHPSIFRDTRGFFLETFQATLLEKEGIGPFVQDNHSYSRKGCLRGMHFQSTPGQAKLVRVAVGTIYDVVVDLRPHSPTYGEWEGVILDDIHHRQLFIPVGFAHGFCVLSEEAHVLYKVSTPYLASTEIGFRWNDPEIGIQWPIDSPHLSARDQEAPFLNQLREKESL